MADGLNASEKFVATHCLGTFLALWGMSNPVGKTKNKELCDFLAVCGSDILIFSVKDIALSSDADKVGVDRWRRRAIESSVDQVYGAERFVGRVTDVKDRNDRIMSLPPVDDRRVYRICVAFGAKGHVGIPEGDFGRGFVHVLDELTFPILLRELDTITDLTGYLNSKEEAIKSGINIVSPGEEQILAFYLSSERAFPQGHACIVLDDTIWPGFVNSPEYRSRVDADKKSYAWDNVINFISKDFLARDLLFEHPPNEGEQALRVLARECRFYRRLLGDALTEVLFGGKVRSRMVQSPSKIAYVFLAMPRDADRKHRLAELGARCHVARQQFKDSVTVIGIASERGDDNKPGLSFDIYMLEKRDWTEEDEKEAEYIKTELGFFQKPQFSKRSDQEYPG